MNKYKYSITVFDNGIYDDVLIRLGDCQQYSDKITNQMLSDAGVDLENGHLNFFSLMKLLKKRKELIVSFYGIKNNAQLHIFSDFFNLEGAFSDAFSFFDDLNSVLMLCENKKNSVLFHLIRSGKILFRFEKNIACEEAEHYAWRQDYEKLCGNTDMLPSASEIENSLDFLLSLSSKSDSQMHEYLEINALSKDKYIL